MLPDAIGKRLVEQAPHADFLVADARNLLGPGGALALLRDRGLEAVSDTGALEGWVEEALAANPKAVESYAAGDAKSLNFLMGQVMRRSAGKADPAAVRALLDRRLKGSE